MTKTNYDQNKRECWEEFRKEHPEISCKSLLRNFVDFIFDRAYALGKQEMDADTVISEWVCRDKKDNALNLHAEEPYRTYSHYNTDDKPDWWESDCASFLPLDNSLFPDLTWDDEPIEVEITIKRKKK